VAGISGIDRVAGTAFDQGFHSACRWAAGALVATALVSAGVLGIRPGAAGFDAAGS